MHSSREEFEAAVTSEFISRGIKIDPNKQFWDISHMQQLPSIFSRDATGSDYSDTAISAMWFGWRLANGEFK